MREGGLEGRCLLRCLLRKRFRGVQSEDGLLAGGIRVRRLRRLLVVSGDLTHSSNTSVQLFKNFLKTFLVFLASLAAQSRDGGCVELRDRADEVIHFCTQV